MEQVIYEDMYRLERAHWWFRARRDILSRIVRQEVAPGGAILDVGCGTGFVLEDLRDAYEVHGIDDAEIAVRLCHEKGLDFVERGVLGKTKLSRADYDMVMFLDVLEHIEDDVGALRAAREVLAPGGKVLIAVPAFQLLWSKHDVIHHHHRRYSKADLERVIRAAGLEPRWTTFFNSLLFPAIFLVRMTAKIRKGFASDAEGLPSRLLNEVLYRTFGAERHLLSHLRLPIGVSLLCIAERR